MELAPQRSSSSANSSDAGIDESVSPPLLPEGAEQVLDYLHELPPVSYGIPVAHDAEVLQKVPKALATYIPAWPTHRIPITAQAEALDFSPLAVPNDLFPVLADLKRPYVDFIAG